MSLMGLTLAASVSLEAEAQIEFPECIDRLGRLAVERGVAAATAERALATAKPLERVIASDRSQPEFVASFADYLGGRVTLERVTTGRALYGEHRELLDRLTARYGIPGQYLLAFWALETNYGRFLGSVPVFDALATLACDQRRGEYFTTELINALHIAERGDVDLFNLQSSWAGALGHTQFMPSAYLDHAVDGDGDGRIDLWASIPDAFASAATYLSALDWQAGVRWGREVLLPDGFDYYRNGLDEPRRLPEWRALGVTDTAGRPVAALDIEASLLLPVGRQGPAFLVYDNFRVIMGWNRSEFFALTVGHLADRIAGAGGLAVAPPELAPMAREQLAAVQRGLNALGFDSGAADGRLGPATRRAIREFQRSRDWIADGFPSLELLQALEVN